VPSSDKLLSALPHSELHTWRLQEIHNIVCDSRRVVPGDLFVAIPGVAVDGHRFVPDAIRAGAVAFVVERMLPELEGLSTMVVPNAREAFAYLHAAWHDFPGRKLKVIGVTGTDGKTTTTRLITSILRAAGHSTGRIDTVSAAIGEQELDTGFHTTTPDAPEVQGYLAQMVVAGMEYAVVESTSHGLAQHRVTGCEYDVAVVTNITHEHLDYHGTFDAYRDAKAMLFRALSTSARKPGVHKVAVLNADDSSYDYLRPIPADVHLTYGLQPSAQVTAREISNSPSGLHFLVATPGSEVEITSPLVGPFNVSNILAAISVAYSQGILPEAIRAGVASMQGVSGRMERIVMGQPFTVVVDFAHTPNALENALRTVRQLTKKQITVVFGCAGLRDHAKRSWMGEVAGRLADKTVITAEDPRTESLGDIMEEIAVGCRKAGGSEGQDFWRVADRGQAIAQALEMARPGDVVIVTGKGHERSMCFGTTEYPWSDHEAAQEGLRRLGYTGT
jgi:UDP-N-acetylmuramoyl-L-alanyl-D-glutamate--2,6-diaminopimelate ligase